jgi:hypothetical protein
VVARSKPFGLRHPAALSLSILVVTLAGCSTTVPNPPVTELAAGRTTSASLSSTIRFLYLGNEYGSVSKLVVYPLLGSKPLRKISRSWNVYAIAIDPWNDVYTTDDNPSGGSIVAYTPGGKSILLSIGVDFAKGLAFDKSGNLYIADTVAVEEYAARSTKRLRIIRTDTRDNDALAFDPKGNLYVARLASYGSSGPSSIEVFAPGASRPFRTITDGIRMPVGLLFDNKGNLYVDNCPPCYSSNPDKAHGGSITEYAPGGHSPFRTVSRSLDWPVAVAFDSHGLLFVANRPFQKKGWITVYSSGADPVRVVTDGINGPAAFAVGPQNYLYVANSAAPSITVYTPGGSQLVRTITDGVKAPSAIAIGKE